MSIYLHVGLLEPPTSANISMYLSNYGPLTRHTLDNIYSVLIGPNGLCLAWTRYQLIVDN